MARKFKRPNKANQPTERTDAWKDDIRGYYGNAATQNIKQSDEQYNRAIADADNAALARGMGRSSYALATRANLENKKAESANQIRENASNEANMAILNQQNVQDQMDFQRRQADQQQSNWQAQFDATQKQQDWQNQFAQGQFDYQKTQDQLAQQNWQTQFAYQQTQDQLAQQNWKAQFDAQQAQQKWQNEYQQDLFKYQYVLPTVAGGSPYSTKNPTTTPPPATTGLTAEQLAQTLREIYQIKQDQQNQNKPKTVSPSVYRPRANNNVIK